MLTFGIDVIINIWFSFFGYLNNTCNEKNFNPANNADTL